MNLEIKRLIPELAGDFFDFFDNRAFTDNSPEGPCYCTRYQMTREQEKTELFDRIEENGGGREGFCRALRKVAEEQITSGVLRGYLAYADGVPVGWCNVNDKANYPVESGNGARFHAPANMREKVAACFEIAPGFRGMGIATALLERAVADARSEGYFAVEGYPRVREKRYEWDFTGPVRLFERCGFTETARDGDRATMRIELDAPVRNTELFTGKAEVYAKARPGYPPAALDYIMSLVPPAAVIADVGAGTGKFTVPLAERGCKVFAIEPNADMRVKLVEALAQYKNTVIIDGSAEATGLPDGSVAAVTCAQALHWFDPDAFRAECRRILRPGGLVIAVYNNTPGGSGVIHSRLATDAFFVNPAVCEFPNPIYYTRENWLAYMTSHSNNPHPTDPGYAAHIAEQNARFDRDSADGLLRLDTVTSVYSERV